MPIYNVNFSRFIWGQDRSFLLIVKIYKIVVKYTINLIRWGSSPGKLWFTIRRNYYELNMSFVIRKLLLGMSLGPVVFEDITQPFSPNEILEKSVTPPQSWLIILQVIEFIGLTLPMSLQCQIGRQLKCYLELIPDKTNNLFIWTHSPVHVYRSHDQMTLEF